MKARKRFAQHFLEPAWVAKLVAAIEPAAADTIIEIGPGRGAITVPLSARVAQLLAVEIDRDLAAALQQRGLPNVTVVTADVLEVDIAALARAHLPASGAASPDNSRLRVVGNLPYNISSPILFRLLASAPAAGFHDATLMLQEEVAERLIASPGTGEYGVLTLCTALGADVSRVLSLPPGAFRPAPRVRSAVVRLAFRPPPADVRDPDTVAAIVRSVFTQRRKTLANALAPFASARGLQSAALLDAAGIDPRRRPETLSLAEYGRLEDAIETRLAAGPRSSPRP
jgi:16S rRNA (adenine1518-N6/adenine1519-N6)-dimethyltransferase